MSSGSDPKPGASLGLAALLCGVAGCVFFPLAAALSALFLRGSSGVEARFFALGLGALSVLVAIVLAIVALARGADKTMPIVALVLSVLSLPAGVLAGFLGVIFSGGPLHGRPFRSGERALRTPTTTGDAWSIG